MRIVRNSADVNRPSGAASRASTECGYHKQGVRDLAHRVRCTGDFGWQNAIHSCCLGAARKGGEPSVDTVMAKG